ncbi:unnamed protein product [Chrysoparadoxa australica]
MLRPSLLCTLVGFAVTAFTLPAPPAAVLRRLASAALAGQVMLHGTMLPPLPSLQPAPALALTEEQEVVNDAWKTCNSAYVDQTFNGVDWKATRLKYIKKDYKTRMDAYQGVTEMIKLLGDPYTRFLSPDEFDTIAGLARGGTAQNLAGLGVELGYDKQGDAMVQAVIDQSPAAKAGIQANDIITMVDGEDTKGLSLDSVAALMRGEVGSSVQVVVARASKVLDVTAVREKLKFGGVTQEVTNGPKGQKIGLIVIKSFSKSTASDVADAVKELDKSGVRALVIDLRHNPGGYFPGGIDTARLFLPVDKAIVSVVDKNGISDTYYSLVNGIDTAKPLYVVVDEKTASASEIFSAAVKENGRAKLVGHNTFGKAKVQTLNQLFDGSGVAVTVSLYKTPKGNDINKIGIPVDIKSTCEYSASAVFCLPENL